jgi:hypothetical protein
LERHTSQHIGPETGLPIITLRPDGGHQLTCPFVTPSGCRVYEDRPSSCRTYPLARIVSRARETGEISEQFMLLKEPHCLGFSHGKPQTVRHWNQNQGISIYNTFNDMLMDIISLKNRLRPGLLDNRMQYIFRMALYDLDSFRSQIFEKGILDELHLNSDRLKKVAQDDVALLKLGFQWVKKVLFDT